MENNNYNKFCESKNCPEYIKWDCGYGICISCMKVGESANIDEYPNDCLFKEEIEKVKL